MTDDEWADWLIDYLGKCIGAPTRLEQGWTSLPVIAAVIVMVSIIRHNPAILAQYRADIEPQLNDILEIK